MSVAAAIERDLTDLRKRDSALADSGLAASALELARGMDGDNSLTSKSMAGNQLRETMKLLREMAPKARKKDSIDQLAEQRSKRRSAAAED